MDDLSKALPGVHSGRQVAPYDAVSARLADRGPWEALRASLGPGHQLYLDLRTGEPSLVMGAPVPLVPGAGNDLTFAEMAALTGTPVSTVTEELVGAAADAFLDDHASLLAVSRGELAGRAVHRVHENLWVVTYRHRPLGIPVAASRVTLVVGHGNLILWGSENTFPLTAETPVAPLFPAEQALAAARRYAGWNEARDHLKTGPELVYLPQPGGGGALSGAVEGRYHRLLWELVFQRDGVRGTWLVHVDATTGEVAQFGDLNRYASVRGGIEPLTWTDTEESRPLPLVGLSSGAFSSLEGQYAFGGGMATASLDGELAEISDRCGTPGFPSVDSDPAGDIDFGTGPPNPAGDADCTTNGVGNNGGEHNTHAARSAYYHITRLKDRARRWLPANTWVDSSHQVRVNINDVCNAYWSPGGGYNGFFQEGDGGGGLTCYNTGEIASVFLHEVGHGMDQNDAQGSADGGTGEAYADVVSILDLHRSCIGDVFWTQQCTGYGLPCVACEGVRDADYAQHVDGGGNPVTTPFTPANFTGPQCPGGFFGIGPCGKEVHCEAYPANGALWDLAARKLNQSFDQATAWYITERDWLLGMDLATAMFNCNSTTFASDGCASTSWFMAMKAIDDDDGNLANGTPHAADLFAAFDDHAIACGTAGDATNQNSGSCPALGTPVAAAVRAGGDIQVSWSAVAGAQGYAVLRNHGDCALSYRPLATVAATTFTDTDVADFQSYSYRVVALADAGGFVANSCYSELSNCATPDPAAIFVDGFESGDVSAWSASVP